MPVSARKKEFAISEALEKKRSVSEIARELGVARKTIYSWINQYQKTSPRVKSKAFQAQYSSGKKHHRAIAYKARPILVRLIISHPEWGCRKLSEELKKKGFNLGYFGVNQLLKKLNASTYNLRESFKKNWSGPGRLKADIKLSIIKEILDEGLNVSQVAQKYSIAKKTLYQWIKRYQSAKEDGLVGPITLKEAYARGKNHPRAVDPEVQKQVLKIVIKKPELSIRSLADLVPV